MNKIMISQQEFEQVVEIRRHLHSIPQTGMELSKTCDYVCEQLDKSGIPYQRFADSGMIAEIKGTRKKVMQWSC